VNFPPILRLKTALLAGVFILLAATAQSQLGQKTEINKPGQQGGPLAPDFSLKLGAKTDTSVAGDRISTRHAEITTHVSDQTIAAGNRISLMVDVEPHADIHIYAPGAKGYREISLSIEPNSQIRVLPLQYPVSEISTFTFLNQPVPVFQKPFRLVQDLILAGTPDAQAALREKGSMTILGTLEYQACDEKMCFFPVSVPLTWALNLRPHAQPETNRP
jgi:hypothetical protein